jgi:acyl-CoA dehydrogenase
LVTSVAQRFESFAGDEKALESVEFQMAMNLLKVNASELAIATVMGALQASGLTGYRNDSEFSIGRSLRDILSAPIMINNDRILANVATSSILSQVPSSLRD